MSEQNEDQKPKGPDFIPTIFDIVNSIRFENDITKEKTKELLLNYIKIKIINSVNNDPNIYSVIITEDELLEIKYSTRSKIIQSLVHSIAKDQNINFNIIEGKDFLFEIPMKDM